MKTRSRARRAVKRKYTPQEVIDIIRASVLAGDDRATSAAKADVTIWHCKDVVRKLRAAGELPADKCTRVALAAEEVVRRLQAGEVVADISRDLGFDVQHLIWRARRGKSRRAVDRRIAEAAGPVLPARERVLAWQAKRRAQRVGQDGVAAAC